MSAEPEVSNQRQKGILAGLEARSSVHAGLYSIALRDLRRPAIKGQESARMAVICHCVRELMLGALDILVDTPEPRPEPSSGTLARGLPEVLVHHGSPKLRADQDLIPVPREVAAAFADLIAASTREGGRNQRNAAALVTGSADGAHASIREWSSAYKFFVKWAHVDQHHFGTLPDDEMLSDYLRVVEDVIEVRMNLFFDNLSAIEDILARANGTDDAAE